MTPADDRDIANAAELRRHRERQQREDDARRADLPRAIASADDDLVRGLKRLWRVVVRAAMRWARGRMR